MADPVSRAGVEINDFPGLMTNMAPAALPDAPGGATEQVNLTCVRMGEMRVRPGYRLVEFEAQPLTAPGGDQTPGSGGDGGDDGSSSVETTYTNQATAGDFYEAEEGDPPPPDG